MKIYDAVAHRDGRWWAVEVRNVLPGEDFWTQGRTLDDSEYMARDVIATVLEVPIDDVRVELTVADVEPLLATVAQARAVRDDAAAAEQAALAVAARRLLADGLSQRDAARVLHLSHQRISQLAKQHAA